MIRSELVARIAAQNPHLYETEVEAPVKAIFNRISKALADGDRVELRDFGAFSTWESQPHTGRNPRTGAIVEVKAKTQIHFRPGKAMREQLKLRTSSSEGDVEHALRAS